ncbi:MAG: PQQ-binding-like beta-propeller repeat protein [Limisphaerales bacterium]
MFSARIIAALALVGSLSLSAGDWPQFLGPQRDNSTSEQLDWSTAQRVWSERVGTGWSGPVVKDGKVVLFHRQGDQELIDCRDAKTGKLIWQAKTMTEYVDGFGMDNGPRATPTIMGDQVYCFGAEGNVHCVDLKTGKVRWSNRLAKTLRAPKGFFGLACSPLFHEGKILLNPGAPGGHGIIALDAKTGKLAWKATDDAASYASPVIQKIAGEQRAVLIARANVFSLNPRDGKTHWKHAFSPAIQASVSGSTPLIHDDIVFTTASYGAGALTLKVTKARANVLWENDSSLSCQYHTPLLYRGHLYGFHGRLDTGPRPEFRCVELATGKVKWTNKRVGAGAIIASNGKILLLTVDGQLLNGSVSPEGYRELGRQQVLGFEVRAHPALSESHFYARDKKNLVCFKLR